MKVAAQLVHVTTQNRPLANKHVPLFVPRVIQADINPWVELRNSLWATSVPDKLEKSHEDYIPWVGVESDEGSEDVILSDPTFVFFGMGYGSVRCRVL